MLKALSIEVTLAPKLTLHFQTANALTHALTHSVAWCNTLILVIIICLYFILRAWYLSHCFQVYEGYLHVDLCWDTSTSSQVSNYDVQSLLWSLDFVIQINLEHDSIAISIRFFCEHLTAKTTNFFLLAPVLFLLTFRHDFRCFIMFYLYFEVAARSVVGHLNNPLFSSRGISLFEVSGACPLISHACCDKILLKNVFTALITARKNRLGKTSHLFFCDWDCNWIEIFENKTKKNHEINLNVPVQCFFFFY